MIPRLSVLNTGVAGVGTSFYAARTSACATLTAVLFRQINHWRRKAVNAVLGQLDALGFLADAHADAARGLTRLEQRISLYHHRLGHTLDIDCHSVLGAAVHDSVCFDNISAGRERWPM